MHKKLETNFLYKHRTNRILACITPFYVTPKVTLTYITPFYVTPNVTLTYITPFYVTPKVTLTCITPFYVMPRDLLTNLPVASVLLLFVPLDLYKIKIKNIIEKLSCEGFFLPATLVMVFNLLCLFRM